MGEAGGNKFMAGRESGSKSEYRYIIINLKEKGDKRKCARRSGMATAPRYSVPVRYDDDKAMRAVKEPGLFRLVLECHAASPKRAKEEFGRRVLG
jgi:hypothetical protein